MINAVISEFNPFHNGHKYLIQKAREKTGAKHTVCLMSGDFVQRGEAAICDKHTRAAAAVKNGADLVIQIPTAHSLAGAGVFASSGVYLANSLGVETSLCFGSEDEDISPLLRLAQVSPHMLEPAFRRSISEGKSYGSAVMQAYSECAGQDASLLKSPNNLLAFEYIKAIAQQNSNIKPVNIKRIGCGHDLSPSGEGFASASYIRAHLQDDLSGFMPNQVFDMIDREKLESVLLFSVYSKSAQQLEEYADMSEGLNNRFYTAARTAGNIQELFSLVKSKRYTHAKIRRAAMNVLISNPKGLYRQQAPYLKVLAFNDNGRALLKTLADTCCLPIVIKPQSATYVKGGTEHFALECRAADVYDFCSKSRHGGGREYKNSPVYVR